MTQAATHFTAARTEAEEHGNLGEQAIAQANLAVVTAFTDPARADDEITLARQLLAGLDQRATSLTAQTAAIARDAGTPTSPEPARALRTAIHEAGITAAQTVLELTLVFHHAVQDEQDNTQAAIARLHALTETGDHSYYRDIAHCMAGIPLPEPSTTVWLDGPEEVRTRWHQLVQDRRTHLDTTE
ncbi:hypothetical protein ACIQWL_53865 [Streptomyces mirabilis]|uniref:hypothetical protein n=1 Tax=Streptomyces mirabilis TaxID=68239 RepID=UPI002F91874C